MITKRIFLVVILAVAALVLTGFFVTAPASASGLPTNLMFDNDMPDSILTDTLPTTHPVGIVLATFFNIPYTQVLALHDEGFGFGNIARAYLTAYASGGVLTPTQVLELRQAGAGWGQIKKEYGVHPGGNGLGSIMSNKGATSVVTETIAPVAPAIRAPSHSGPGPGGSGNSNCPGNSCNASGHQNQLKGKPTKAPKIK